MRYRAQAAAVACALWLASERDVRAEGFENIPTGSRTAAMGGTGVARGSDSAMPLLNPAGIALIPASTLSLSASLYQASFIDIPHFIADEGPVRGAYGNVTPSARGVSSSQFSSFPSGIAYFLRLSDQAVLAASLSVPFHSRRELVTEVSFQGGRLSNLPVKSRTSLAAFQEETSYLTALSGAYALGRVRLGAAVHVGYTKSFATEEAVSVDSAGQSFGRNAIEAVLSASSIDAGLMLGMQVDMTDFLSFGLAVRPFSGNLGGSFVASTQGTVLVSGAAPDLPLPVLDESRYTGTYRAGLPFKGSLGSQLALGRWILALDLTFAGLRENARIAEGEVRAVMRAGTKPASETTEPFRRTEKTKAAVDVAFGVEYALTDDFFLRGGIFTNSSKDDLEVDGPRGLYAVPVDLFGLSAGLGSRIGPVDSTLGIRLAFGSGQTGRYNFERLLGGDGPVSTTTPISITEAMFFLSAAVDVGSPAKAPAEPPPPTPPPPTPPPAPSPAPSTPSPAPDKPSAPAEPPPPEEPPPGRGEEGPSSPGAA